MAICDLCDGALFYKNKTSFETLRFCSSLFFLIMLHNFTYSFPIVCCLFIKDVITTNLKHWRKDVFSRFLNVAFFFLILKSFHSNYCCFVCQSKKMFPNFIHSDSSFQKIQLVYKIGTDWMKCIQACSLLIDLQAFGNPFRKHSFHSAIDIIKD